MNWVEWAVFLVVVFVVIMVVAMVVIYKPKLVYPVSILLNIAVVASFLAHKFGFQALFAPEGVIAYIFGGVFGVFFAYMLNKRRDALVSSEYKSK